MARQLVGTDYANANSEAGVEAWFQDKIDQVRRSIWAQTQRSNEAILTPQADGKDVDFGEGPAVNMPSDVRTLLQDQPTEFLWRWQTAESESVRRALLVELTGLSALAGRWAKAHDVLLELRFVENSPTSFDVSCATYLKVIEPD